MSIHGSPERNSRPASATRSRILIGTAAIVLGVVTIVALTDPLPEEVTAATTLPAPTSPTTQPPPPSCDADEPPPAAMLIGIQLVNGTDLDQDGYQVSLGRNAIWLAAWETGEIMRLDLASLEIAASAQIEPYGPIAMATDGSDLWLSSYGTQELVLLDADTLEEEGRISLRLQHGLLLTQELLWIPCCGNETEHRAGVLHAMVRADRTIRTFDIPNTSPRQAVLSGNDIWLLSELPAALVQVETETMTETQRINLINTGTHLASGGESILWTVDGPSGGTIRAFSGSDCVSQWTMPGGVSGIVAGRNGVAVVTTWNRTFALQLGSPGPIEVGEPEGLPRSTSAALSDDTLVLVVGDRLSVYRLQWEED